MAKWNIYSKDGRLRTTVRKFSYEGVYMGESNIKMDIASPDPIEFAIDDFIDYRGERYVMSNLPSVERVARDRSYGGALQYNDVVFRSMAIAELENCIMLDYVISDNNLHYTSLPNFAFYCDSNPYITKEQSFPYSAGVRQLADRILANTQRLYGEGAWEVRIEDETFIKESVSISVSNQNVWNVMADACDKMDINFTARVLVENGSIVKREIVLGAKLNTIDNEFKYGKGNGLVSLERNAVNGQDIITRLTAYGNTRNIPYRYYNYLWYRLVDGERIFKYYRLTNDTEDATKDQIVDEEGNTWLRVCNPSMYVPNLMLPSFRQNGTFGTPNYAYIDSDNIATLGIKEGVKFFNSDDNDNQDIYPSLTGMTMHDLFEALSDAERHEQNINKNDETILLDAIVEAEQVSFSGIIPEEQESAPRFTLRLNNLGFDPNDTIIDNESPAIEMKSGMCVGRKFNVLSITKNTHDSLNWYYDCECEVDADTSINQYFPNVNYQIESGDKFVLTGIRMPDVYVSVAEKRLEAAATAWLAENDHPQYTYTPKIDNIFMAKHPDVANAMKEGLRMNIVDESLGINENIVISQLKIEEGYAIIPKWEVTLSDDLEPTLAQRVVDEISAQIPIVGGGGVSMNQSLYNNIMTLLNSLPDNYISKTRADKAQGYLRIMDGIETGGYQEGNGVKVTDRMIDVVSVSRTSEQVKFDKIEQYFSPITQNGSKSVSGQFIYNAGTEGGFVYIPMSFSWSVLKIIKTAITVTDNTGEEVYNYEIPKGVDSLTAEVPLNKEDRNVVYTVTVTVVYSASQQIEGSLIIKVGNNGDYIVSDKNAGSGKMKATLTSTSLQFLGSLGLGLEPTFGMELHVGGLRVMDNGEWKDVEFNIN